MTVNEWRHTVHGLLIILQQHLRIHADDRHYLTPTEYNEQGEAAKNSGCQAEVGRGEDDDVTEKGNFVIELLIKNRP